MVNQSSIIVQNDNKWCNGISMHYLTIKGWNIYRCNDCGLQHVYPVPSEDELSELYNKPDKAYINRLYDKNYGRLSFPRQWGIIKKLMPFNNGTILDYGCSGGHFLDRVSSSWEKCGVELSSEAREVANSKGIITFESLDKMPFTENYYDVITMFAVIEHLPNPKEIVEKLSKLLKKNGLFVVMTGDVNSFKAYRQGIHWHLYAPPGHLYYFTQKSLDKLMSSFGYIKVKHLYTDGGETNIKFKLLNLMLRIIIEIYHRIPYFNTLPLFDCYYGYYRKA